MIFLQLVMNFTSVLFFSFSLPGRCSREGCSRGGARGKVSGEVFTGRASGEVLPGRVSGEVSSGEE